jgi:hypothetical protein
VPESVILKRKPGEVFVLVSLARVLCKDDARGRRVSTEKGARALANAQRNVANQFRPDDDSANGLLEYAVGPVGVEHGECEYWREPERERGPRQPAHGILLNLAPIPASSHVKRESR